MRACSDRSAAVAVRIDALTVPRWYRAAVRLESAADGDADEGHPQEREFPGRGAPACREISTLSKNQQLPPATLG
jgi:hypothetical protein